jgi:hypothetical protein
MMEIGRPKNPVNSVPKIPTDSVKRKRNSKRKPEPQPEPEPTFWTAEDFAAGGCGAQDVGKPRPPLATSPWGTDVNDPALRRMLHYQGGVKELVRWGYRNPTEFYTFVVPLIRDEVQAALAAAYPQE